MHIQVSTDIELTAEPLLQLVAAGGESYIAQYTKEIAAETNASELALIKKMCVAARELCERETELTFGQKTLIAFYYPDDVEFRDRELDLPYGPVSSISEVLSISEDGETETTLTVGTGYYLLGGQFKRVSIPKVYTTQPGTNSKNDSIKITYVAGFGAADCETLPEVLKVAMAKQVTEWWHNRNNWIPVLHSEIREILQNYKRNVL